MNDSFIILGVVAGVICMGAQIYVTHKRGFAPNLADAVALILSGIGVLTGVKVCWYAVAFSETPPLNEISIQVFIGGVAVIWVSLATIIKKFRS